MRPAIDRTGVKYGLLTVTRRAGTDPMGHATWECLCECGTTVIRAGRNLIRSANTSCGCTRATGRPHVQGSHGLSDTPAYRCWARILQRCLNPNDDAYPNYGGRGITVCDRWMDFENFHADMGPQPKGLSIERADNDGPYAPGNCSWGTKHEQVRNHRRNVWVEFNGRRQIVADWAKELGIAPRTLRNRLKHWSVERALTQPVRSRND